MLNDKKNIHSSPKKVSLQLKSAYLNTIKNEYIIKMTNTTSIVIEIIDANLGILAIISTLLTKLHAITN